MRRYSTLATNRVRESVDRKGIPQILGNKMLWA
ncbi:hypothetical protein T12_2241 [Trichinella patagoniensis]|uniref:Uncharacterized protein n=1 Tax=Trichinella patagoniensis TaxID=990121 RepID=A0A0V0YTK7_9BILA|nr:hypothetical protein T12_8012 [Trichinella patagoniensis]KRY03114.1 hypothetical protein T12_2241 [Trichinella patagoniensis]